MILGDFLLKGFLEKKEHIEITPLEENQIRPASIDLTLGGDLLIPRVKEFFNFREELEYEKGHIRNFLHPNQFTLATTREYIKLSNRFCGFVVGRSSIGRAGLIVENAGFIDPGFEGNITLELLNTSRTSMQLKEGMRICQLVIMDVNGVQNGYGERNDSKYQGQKNTTGSRVHKDR